MQLSHLSRAGALLLALSFGAVACGSSDAAESSNQTLANSTASGDAEESGSQDEAADSAGQDDAAADVASEHVFPDLDVLDVSDGSTLNLAAELGGGDTPVLLWFWAPH